MLRAQWVCVEEGRECERVKTKANVIADITKVITDPKNKSSTYHSFLTMPNISRLPGNSCKGCIRNLVVPNDNNPNEKRSFFPASIY